MSWRPSKPAKEGLNALDLSNLDLSNSKPPWLSALPLQHKARIPLRNFYFLMGITEADFAAIRPDEKRGVGEGGVVAASQRGMCMRDSLGVHAAPKGLGNGLAPE